MDCLLIFDHLNDLIYSKYNRCFEDIIRKSAIQQELLILENHHAEIKLDNNILIQLFAPIISSHRIMHFQFGNSYNTINFKDMKLTFCEFMGYLFMVVSDGNIKNIVDIFITFARYLCGSDIIELNRNEIKRKLYGQLIENWKMLRKTNQAIFLEAIEQLLVNSVISANCLKILKKSITNISSVHTECSKVHALLFVGTKFLSLYSSVNAKSISPSDILFLTILTRCIKNDAINTEENRNFIKTYQVFLSGLGENPQCSIHAVHIIEIYDNIFLVYLVEHGDSSISASLYESFYHLHRLRFIQSQREKESIQCEFEQLELVIKKLSDSLKKTKLKNLDALFKLINKKWEILRLKYKEYLKTPEENLILRAETLMQNFLDNLKDLHKILSSDENSHFLNCSSEHVLNASPLVQQELSDFYQYFTIKELRNFSLGSRDSLTITKYLEEFPGLVHFIYIDRNNHRITTPTLNVEDEKTEFIQERIWSMIEVSHSSLKEGHSAVIWKDKIFTYGYFLWFEDKNGEPLKIGTHHHQHQTMKIDKNPGILFEDYYLKLKIGHFSKFPPSKVRVYELFVINLGLVTATSVLEQAKKLASTIWELKGFPNHAIDLL